MGGKGSGRNRVRTYRGLTPQQIVALFYEHGFFVSVRTVYAWARGIRKPSKSHQAILDKIT